MRAVIGGPRERRRSALPLPGPESEQKCEVQMLRRSRKNARLVVIGPDFRIGILGINPPCRSQRIGGSKTPVQRP